MWVFASANLPYWILLGAGLGLFGTTISLGGGEEDADGDAGDATDDSEAGEDTDSSDRGAPLLGTLLAALGVGKAPLLILLAVDFSLWGFFGWAANVAVASGLGRMPSAFWGWGGGVFGVSLAVALFVGSFVARAIGSLTKSFSEDSRADRLIGCGGTVSSATLSKDRIGQVDVIDPTGNRVTISVRLPEWAEQIPTRGQEVVIIDWQPEGYVAIADKGLDRRRWLA